MEDKDISSYEYMKEINENIKNLSRSNDEDNYYREPPNYKEQYQYLYQQHLIREQQKQFRQSQTPPSNYPQQQQQQQQIQTPLSSNLQHPQNQQNKTPLPNNNQQQPLTNSINQNDQQIKLPSSSPSNNQQPSTTTIATTTTPSSLINLINILKKKEEIGMEKLNSVNKLFDVEKSSYLNLVQLLDYDFKRFKFTDIQTDIVKFIVLQQSKIEYIFHQLQLIIVNNHNNIKKYLNIMEYNDLNKINFPTPNDSLNNTKEQQKANLEISISNLNIWCKYSNRIYELEKNNAQILKDLIYSNKELDYRKITILLNNQIGEVKSIEQYLSSLEIIEDKNTTAFYYYQLVEKAERARYEEKLKLERQKKLEEQSSKLQTNEFIPFVDGSDTNLIIDDGDNINSILNQQNQEQEEHLKQSATREEENDKEDIENPNDEQIEPLDSESENEDDGIQIKLDSNYNSYQNFTFLGDDDNPNNSTLNQTQIDNSTLKNIITSSLLNNNKILNNSSNSNSNNEIINNSSNSINNKPDILQIKDLLNDNSNNNNSNNDSSLCINGSDSNKSNINNSNINNDDNDKYKNSDNLINNVIKQLIDLSNDLIEEVGKLKEEKGELLEQLDQYKQLYNSINKNGNNNNNNNNISVDKVNGNQNIVKERDDLLVKVYTMQADIDQLKVERERLEQEIKEKNLLNFERIKEFNIFRSLQLQSQVQSPSQSQVQSQSSALITNNNTGINNEKNEKLIESLKSLVESKERTINFYKSENENSQHQILELTQQLKNEKEFSKKALINWDELQNEYKKLEDNHNQLLNYYFNNIKYNNKLNHNNSNSNSNNIKNNNHSNNNHNYNNHNKPAINYKNLPDSIDIYDRDNRLNGKKIN